MTNPFPNNPLFSSLTEAHKFATTTPALDVDVDQLSDIVEHHKYSGHPDDECNYESCMRGELEIALENATRLQEEVNNLVDLILDQPDLALKFGAFEELHRLRAKHSNK